MSAEELPATGSPEKSWSQKWSLVTALSVLGGLGALVAAGEGWLSVHPFASGRPDWGMGTFFWALSAALLAVPLGVTPGPARRRRAAIAVTVGLLWFVVGRFLLA